MASTYNLIHRPSPSHSTIVPNANRETEHWARVIGFPPDRWKEVYDFIERECGHVIDLARQVHCNWALVRLATYDELLTTLSYNQKQWFSGVWVYVHSVDMTAVRLAREVMMKPIVTMTMMAPEISRPIRKDMRGAAEPGSTTTAAVSGWEQQYEIATNPVAHLPVGKSFLGSILAYW